MINKENFKKLLNHLNFSSKGQVYQKDFAEQGSFLKVDLPELILEHINWDNNTVVYFCTARNNVIETTWMVFKRCWKNFLFMDDGSLLIGKKRKEVVQFLSNGTCKVGNKP